MIKLIVDSTCDLSEEILEKYDIRILSLHISLAEKEFRDKMDITTDEVFSAMKKGIVPKTSQVSPADIADIFSEYCREGNDFIYLTFSSAMSGTCQTAKMILSGFKERYPELNMEVIDSKAGSTAIGLMALQAAQMIEMGCSFKTVAEQLKEMTDHVEHIFTISDIGWLVRGGRINKLKGAIGSIMNIKPILEVKKGTIQLFGKARGSKNAINTVVDIFKERAKEFPEQIIGISHSNDLQGAQYLKNIIAEKCGAKNFIINQIGGVLGSHLGLGGLGVFFFNKKLPYYEF